MDTLQFAKRSITAHKYSQGCCAEQAASSGPALVRRGVQGGQDLLRVAGAYAWVLDGVRI